LIDGVGRFAWTFMLTPWGATGIPEIDSMIYAVIEILRRAMWGVFRVENEHLNNCDQFRAVRDVPLPMELRSRALQDKPLLTKVKTTLEHVRSKRASMIVE